MSKKAITRIQAAIVIIVIIAAAAAGAYYAMPPVGPTTSTTTSVAVKNPDAIIDETIGQPDTLDPATDYETAGAGVIQNVYEQLMWFKGSQADSVRPWLAESADLSADGLTYTYHLRSGITFTDGTPMDGNAVYFSLMRAMLMDDPDGPAWAMLQVARGGANYSKQYNNAGPSAPDGYGDKYTQAELKDFLDAKPVEIIDPMTVAVHLERPYAGWNFIMAFSVTAIVDPVAIKANWTAPTDGTAYIDGVTCGDYHNELNPWPASNMVGTGPYILKSWDKASQTITLVRNEKYWGGPDNRGLAPVPNVIIKGIDNDNTRVLDLKAGDADVALIPATGGLIFQFVDESTWFSQGNLVSLNPSEWQVYPQCPPTSRLGGKCLWASLNTNFMGFNAAIRGADRKVQAFQPFADLRIRKAFTFALNRTALIHDVSQDFALPADQIIPPGMFGYDSSIQQTPYDPDQAKALLMDASAHPLNANNTFDPKNPQTVEITYNIGNTNRETSATLIATTINSFSADTGLYVKVAGLAWPQFLANVRARQSNVFFLGWIVDYVDPDDFLVPFAHATAGTFAIRMGYNNPEVTSLIDQQATIADKTQRLQVISQIEKKVNDDYAFLWTTYGTNFQTSRTWLTERADASVAGGISSYNQAVYGYYYYELQKGASSSSSPTGAIASLLAALLLPSRLSAFAVKTL
jgi:peptide/nickel transport system substrate-binding protein